MDECEKIVAVGDFAGGQASLAKIPHDFNYDKGFTCHRN
jgi:hypothetical protein